MLEPVPKGKTGAKEISADDRARGQRILELRVSLGMTQLEFARFVGVGTDQTVSRWERGETSPSGKDLASIESKTGTAVRYILHGGDAPLAAPQVLIDFFKSPTGERLTAEQRKGLIMLLRERDVDEFRIRAAVELLFPPQQAG